MDERENVLNGIGTVEDAMAATEGSMEEEDILTIRFRKPYVYEKVEYTEIDLSGMENLTGADMVAINKVMARSGQGSSSVPEVSLEYAFHFAAKAAKLPIEFFMGMPPKEALKVKNSVMAFLFGKD